MTLYKNCNFPAKIVDAVGNAVAIKMFHMTEDVEKAGGMMTNVRFCFC